MSEELKNNSADFNLDLSYLQDVASGSTEFMIEMIELFLTQTPAYFDQLGQLIIDENWSAVADIAHKIKPTLAFMGVESARGSMAEIEQNARNLKKLETIPPAFKLLKDMSVELFIKLAQIKSDLEKTI
ncbi:HPt (histidine-containing phosphotransfer) domain-containing protein [Daejeonella rubra]|uniref:HPt (Histidine-containing phosphotransfer) domain-containing protein n=1 Tax=Daejeonella rubra TaxID=990371 RepID=A0A1G9QJ56_9SPHI|nr:Hpt domain-containing protein [Daejeonella rubra]SDM11072.1 HPt (histidine-containing phosphotransfer) domain-containing protein [Daejeonella rubra]